MLIFFLRISVLCSAFTAILLPLWAAEKGEIDQSRTPYEQTGNWYYWQFKPNDFPIITEEPRPAALASSHGAPLTIYNSWPEDLSNASIFPYLLSSEIGQKHHEFYKFVQEWYQCACAVVCRESSINTKVIGSGVLIGDTTVATARHNFQNVPTDQLFVRFFRYTVQNTAQPGILYIQENYLDMPVINRYTAKEELDAGYLEIPKLQKIFCKYAKVLPIQQNLFDSLIPIGHYAMFHFAGGKPQISLEKGEETPSGASLHSAIALQAGPGASGAAIIYKALSQVQGGGISIYRLLENGFVDRRILSFSQILNPELGYKDGISYPYYFNTDFFIIPTDALKESGYEFLRWRDEAHGKRRGPNGNLFSKPSYEVYRVNDNHSAHHIIPIDDMIYLWEYLHAIDENSLGRIRAQVKKEAQAYGQQHYDQQFDRDARYNALRAEEIENQYGRFHALLTDLYPSFYDNHQLRRLNTKNGFSWSLWNLFKGWNGNFRVDDPTAIVAELYSRDYSERTRPLGFNTELWDSIKNLHNLIQQLKSTPIINTEMEDGLYLSLRRLTVAWNHMEERSRRSIYQFDVNDWEVVGSKAGHDLYRVRPNG